MKRIAVTVLSLALAVMLGACGNNNQDIAATNSAAAPITTAGSSAATTHTNPDVADTPLEPIPEQLAETTNATVSGTDSTASTALKINQMPPAAASRWQEGVNYTRLVPAQPTTAAPGQVEVTEVFWYGCPHCNVLDPYLETWRKQAKPVYVNFVRVPVMWGAVHHTHARLFYTAELLGKLDTLHSAIFREIQTNNNPLISAEQIEKFFTSNGVSQTDFQKAFSSFAVESNLKRAETLGVRYKVDSVPLIIINGTYVTDVGKAGGQQQLISLINELAARAHGT
ncbi:MAG: DsbA family protein [Steroidobacteraceae bacterium]